MKNKKLLCIAFVVSLLTVVVIPLFEDEEEIASSPLDTLEFHLSAPTTEELQALD